MPETNQSSHDQKLSNYLIQKPPPQLEFYVDQHYRTYYEPGVLSADLFYGPV